MLCEFYIENTESSNRNKTEIDEKSDKKIVVVCDSNETRKESEKSVISNLNVLKQTFGRRRKASVQNLYRCHLCSFSCVDKEILLNHFADIHPC